MDFALAVPGVELTFFIAACVVLCLGFVTGTVCWLLLSTAWFAVLPLFSNSFGVWFVDQFFFPKISLSQLTFLFFFCPSFSPPVLLGKSELDGGLGAAWGHHSSDTRYKRWLWCQNLENPFICLFLGEQFILQSCLRTKHIFGYLVVSFILFVKVANTFALYYGHLFE